MPRKPAETIAELGDLKRLTKTEEKLMDIIWDHPDGIRSDEIYEFFPHKTGNKSTTLHRISQKGYVKAEQQGLHHMYWPKLTRLDYSQALIRQILAKNFDSNSLERLIGIYCGVDELSKDQMEQIQALFKSLQKPEGV